MEEDLWQRLCCLLLPVGVGLGADLWQRLCCCLSVGLEGGGGADLWQRLCCLLEGDLWQRLCCCSLPLGLEIEPDGVVPPVPPVDVGAVLDGVVEERP